MFIHGTISAGGKFFNRKAHHEAPWEGLVCITLKISGSMIRTSVIGKDVVVLSKNGCKDSILDKFDEVMKFQMGEEGVRAVLTQQKAWKISTLNWELVTKEIDGKPADHGFIPFRDYVVCHGGLFEDGSRVNPMELLKFRDSLPHTAIYGFWPPPTWIVRTTREKLDQAFDEGNVEGANYSSFIEIFRERLGATLYANEHPAIKDDEPFDYWVGSNMNIEGFVVWFMPEDAETRPKEPDTAFPLPAYKPLRWESREVPASLYDVAEICPEAAQVLDAINPSTKSQFLATTFKQVGGQRKLLHITLPDSAREDDWKRAELAFTQGRIPFFIGRGCTLVLGDVPPTLERKESMMSDDEPPAPLSRTLSCLVPSIPDPAEISKPKREEPVLVKYKTLRYTVRTMVFREVLKKSKHINLDLPELFAAHVCRWGFNISPYFLSFLIQTDVRKLCSHHMRTAKPLEPHESYLEVLDSDVAVLDEDERYAGLWERKIAGPKLLLDANVRERLGNLLSDPIYDDVFSDMLDNLDTPQWKSELKQYYPAVKELLKPVDAMQKCLQIGKTRQHIPLTVYLFAAVPGTGKTSWCKAGLFGDVCVSLDEFGGDLDRALNRLKSEQVATIAIDRCTMKPDVIGRTVRRWAGLRPIHVVMVIPKATSHCVIEGNLDQLIPLSWEGICMCAASAYIRQIDDPKPAAKSNIVMNWNWFGIVLEHVANSRILVPHDEDWTYRQHLLNQLGWAQRVSFMTANWLNEREAKNIPAVVDVEVKKILASILTADPKSKASKYPPVYRGPLAEDQHITEIREWIAKARLPEIVLDDAQHEQGITCLPSDILSAPLFVGAFFNTADYLEFEGVMRETLHLTYAIGATGPLPEGVRIGEKVKLHIDGFRRNGLAWVFYTRDRKHITAYCAGSNKDAPALVESCTMIPFNVEVEATVHAVYPALGCSPPSNVFSPFPTCSKW